MHPALLLLVAPLASLAHASTVRFTPSTLVADDDSLACISNPLTSSCVSFVYPEANATSDLARLCSMMNFMPGCSVRSLCDSSVDSKLGSYCAPFSTLADVCHSDMPNMSGCSSYKSMCLTDGSVVAQCLEEKMIPGLPGTDRSVELVKSICEEMPMMSGCSKCVFTAERPYPDCDLLGTYVQLCKAMPGMDQCTDWKTMCLSIPDSTLCAYSSAEDLSACLQDPSEAICSGYYYPDENSTADMTTLCTQMSFMPGCTVRNLCNIPDAAAKLQEYCAPFSLLADVCHTDMPMMGSCRSYTSMCNNPESVIAQCLEQTMIPGLPSTDRTIEQVKSICSEMYMDGCNTCTFTEERPYPDCDLLGVYVKLCKAMPEMNQCQDWKVMCRSIPDSTLCSYAATNGTERSPPAMLMYFHSGIRDYILFYEWVPQDELQYGLTLAALFVAGVVLEGLLIGRERLEHYLRGRVATLAKKNDESEAQLRKRNVRNAIQAFFLRFVVTLIVAIWAYCVMLAVMSYNIGVFFAAVAGIAIGRATFAAFIPADVPLPEDSCGC